MFLLTSSLTGNFLSLGIGSFSRGCLLELGENLLPTLFRKHGSQLVRLNVEDNEVIVGFVLLIEYSHSFFITILGSHSSLNRVEEDTGHILDMDLVCLEVIH